MSTTKDKRLFYVTNLAIKCLRPQLYVYDSHLSVNPIMNSYAYKEVIFSLLRDTIKRQFLLSEITCQRPQMYDTHLSVTPWKASYTYNEVITFSCSDGYQISGSTSTTCEKSGYFHGSLPKCTDFIFFSLLELLMEMFDIYVFCMYISFVFDSFHL